MSDELTHGLMDCQSIEGAATGGDITTALRPPEGSVWKVLLAFGHHDDDGGNRNCRWSIYDGTDTAWIPGNDRAANVQEPFYTANTPHLLTITYARYLKFTVGSLVAGHKPYIWAVVEVHKGMGTVE